MSIGDAELSDRLQKCELAQSTHSRHAIPGMTNARSQRGGAAIQKLKVYGRGPTQWPPSRGLFYRPE